MASLFETLSTRCLLRKSSLACAEADSDLTCQAGARWEDVNQVIIDKGIPLFFPVSALYLHANNSKMTVAFWGFSLIPGQAL